MSWLGARLLEQVSRHVTFTVALEAERDALADAYRTQDNRRLAQHAENLADLASSDASFSQPAVDLLKSAAVTLKRMRDLDKGHAKREDTLRQELEEATRALVQQQAALASADRMAVVGDLLARLAHDLRNPLSGVLIALTNMREEIYSAEHAERLTTVISELERIARIFNDIVNEPRLTPERPQCLQLSRVVDDVVKLLLSKQIARKSTAIAIPIAIGGLV